MSNPYTQKTHCPECGGKNTDNSTFVDWRNDCGWADEYEQREVFNDSKSSEK